ncbi:Aste57867_4634 [Aphanomyces stellatus]|uniref:Aste57867_4634 protein n=1 Tax=Aphanomyces stellatus TaxID=120398 RepID=A0A485KD55_9STRA|nr:hypothetical protein As57867_004621 [Aphanomyces stellatus]VFT81738.1 Aste57867_4634 [Aphanomyces stellatus]
MAATNNLLNAAALNDPLYASLKSMSTASPETFLTWKQIGATAGRRHSQISLLADAATISLAQPGLYHIQARGVIDASDIGSGLRLIVGSTSTATSALVCDGPIQVVQISHMLIAPKDTTVKFQCFGQYNIHPGVKLTVVLLQAFA